MGDFDYPNTDWAGGTALLTKNHNFLNVMQYNFISQMVKAPSRINSLLDLIITNNLELIEDVVVRDNG